MISDVVHGVNDVMVKHNIELYYITDPKTFGPAITILENGNKVVSENFAHEKVLTADIIKNFTDKWIAKIITKQRLEKIEKITSRYDNTEKHIP